MIIIFVLSYFFIMNCLTNCLISKAFSNTIICPQLDMILVSEFLIASDILVPAFSGTILSNSPNIHNVEQLFLFIKSQSFFPGLKLKSFYCWPTNEIISKKQQISNIFYLFYS